MIGDGSSVRTASRRVKIPLVTVFHIAERRSWEEQKASGRYRHPSLDSEGFIHCSDEGQVARTLARFFPGRTDLVLLEIDPERLTSELHYEEGEPGELFPHLYGPLNVDAVVRELVL